MKYYYFQMLLDSLVFFNVLFGRFFFVFFRIFMFSVCWLNWKGRSVSGSNLIWSLYSGPPAFELSQAQPSGIEAGLCPFNFLWDCEMLWEMGVSWVRLVVKALPMCEGRATDCSSWGSQPRRRMLEVKLWRLSVIPIISNQRLSIGWCTKRITLKQHSSRRCFPASRHLRHLGACSPGTLCER